MIMRMKVLISLTPDVQGKVVDEFNPRGAWVTTVAQHVQTKRGRTVRSRESAEVAEVVFGKRAVVQSCVVSYKDDAVEAR